ncbi:MAG TPA: hypothetical protein VIL17_00100 [Coriobacteriia bacterium]
MNLPFFQPLYLVVVAGIVGFLLLVFEVLVGRRFIKFKGATHQKVHRGIAYTLVALMLVHGLYAVGTLVFGWF